MAILRTACAALLIALALQSQAQDTARTYPARPLRLIAPIAPGGSLDIIARTIAQKLGENLGQTIVVDNRPGAGGSIGAELAARSSPDGYTLIIISATGIIHPLLYKVRFDMRRDFAPVSQVTRQPYILVVYPSLPIRSVTELIAYAKSKPGQLNYASTGPGSLIHMAGEAFKVATGTDIVHVPYKGMGAAYPDLVSGRIQLTFAGSISVAHYLREKQLRALAITSPQRAKFLPDLPTVAEAGAPGFAVMQWYGVLTPAGTARTVVERLNREIVKVLQQREVATRLENDGSEGVGSSPQQFAAHIKSETDKWAQVIKQIGIRGE